MTAAALDSLYRDQVLSHSRIPQGFGANPAADVVIDGNNPLCGDKLTVYLSTENDRISALSFEGTGCAISVASASMMVGMLTGQSLENATRTIEQVRVMLATSNDAPVASELTQQPVAALSAVRQYPSRVKCAALAWQAAGSALAGNQQPVTTE